MNLGAYLRDLPQGQPSLLSRSSDLALALLIVAIVALMIIPLPSILIDALVATNIVIGVMLVLMGIYVSTALQFSAFPSVLLISTLFRLALSVATTRMILLHGDAGDIIDTFGHVVAGGNLVVGLVVFLIITLVQFLVIAKGAERVAEVGARFTLDAMPGKQLSIDSDLRSGLIDKHEARTKRRELELESKLHGSMDGAMKFVKGDAIAGIVIICINLIGGLAVGVFQRDMLAGAAMAKYSILTIGDGLVAQIPALLGAMSAGLIVTRATDTDADRHLGDSIQKQFSAIPRVMLVAGGVCFLMAWVPGFPGLIFLLLGLGLLGCAGFLGPALKSHLLPSQTQQFDAALARQTERPIHTGSEALTASVRQAVPLMLELPRSAVAENATQHFEQVITDAVDAVQLRSGVALPALRFHWRSDDTGQWLLHAFEVPITRGDINGSLDVTAVVEQVDLALRRSTSLFLGVQESGQLLQAANADYPDIVKETLRSIPAQNIAAILRNLVEEEVSIRNLRGILEALVQAAQHEKDIGHLTEFARMALARQTCYRYAPDGSLRAIALAAPLEEQLLEAIRTNNGFQQLSLDPRLGEALQQALIDAIDSCTPDVVLTNVQLRRHLRTMLARDRFEIPVLSYNELVPTLDLQIVHQVTVDNRVRLASA